jgi:UDP-N-acetylmuramyl pentapeptide phosphotransferase/UDP-N-acetylglucosamine-1-phosphate transferase
MREVILFVSAVLLTVIIIPLLRRFSFAIGYLDRPGGDPLKVHAVPIPHSGGLAIFGIFTLVMIFLSLTGFFDGHEMIRLLAGGSLALALGVWDDLTHIHPGIRFIGEKRVFHSADRSDCWGIQAFLVIIGVTLYK